MSDLLDRVRDKIRHRHYSYRTETTYVRWVERYVRYHARQLGRFVHPRELREPQVEAFLNHLAAERNVAASTQTQALSALLFLYDAVLEAPLDVMGGLRRVPCSPLDRLVAREQTPNELANVTGSSSTKRQLYHHLPPACAPSLSLSV